MTAKTVHFSAHCPYCEKSHHHAAEINKNPSQPPKTVHSFLCCGHEFGFSVRRTLAACLNDDLVVVMA